MILLSNLNLSRNQLINAVIEVESTATAPQNPKLGQIYFDSDFDALMQYTDGHGWVPIGVETPTDLSVGTRAATTLEIVSSTGENVIIPAATTTQAGLITSTEKNKLAGIPTLSADGQLMIGASGSPSAAATLTPGTGIDISNGPGSITIGHSNSVTGTGYGPSANTTLTYSETFFVPRFTFDNQGHIISGANCIVKMMAAPTKTTVGLGNVTNHRQVKAIASSTEGMIPLWNGNNGDSLRDGYYPTDGATPWDNSQLLRAGDAQVYIDGIIAANNAMVYKGTLGTGGTITALPTTYKTGWTYVVVTAGTYAGNSCEIGDMIIAIVTRASGGENTDWTVVQANINGAVIGPASSTSGNFPIFSGTTGKLIANSTFNSNSFAQINAIGALTNVGGTSSSSFIVGNTGGTVSTAIQSDTTSSGVISVYDIGAQQDFIAFRAKRFISTQNTGIAPLTVASTTLVSNLNADLLDGKHASAFVTGPLTSTIGEIPVFNNTTGNAIVGTGLNFEEEVPKILTNVISGNGTDSLLSINVTSFFRSPNIIVTIKDVLTSEIVLVDTKVYEVGGQIFVDIDFAVAPPAGYEYAVTMMGHRKLVMG